MLKNSKRSLRKNFIIKKNCILKKTHKFEKNRVLNLILTPISFVPI